MATARSDWTLSDDELAAVKMGAACGARSVTLMLQAVRDAVEGVVAAYTEARCQGVTVDHPAAWAHTVARRLAARWMRHRARNQPLVCEGPDEPDAVAAPGDAAHDEQVATVRRLLRRGRYLLTAQQRVAVELILDNCSLHAASRAAGVDRATFKRTLRTATGRLRNSLRFGTA